MRLYEIHVLSTTPLEHVDGRNSQKAAALDFFEEFGSRVQSLYPCCFACRRVEEAVGEFD